MGAIDWGIVLLYISGIIWLGFFIGSKQKGKEDYYLAGRRMKPWQVALSIVSTQISAISLIGAPAFVAIRKGGGLFWLQYEFAVPLAMIGILIFLVPVYHRKGLVSIYEFLESRFDRQVRKAISFIFLLSRGAGTAVALLATSVVTAVCLSISLKYTILLVGVVTIIYTTMGGIKADIYSDIMQFFIFVAGVLFSVGFVSLYLLKTGVSLSFPVITRLNIFKIKELGFRSGETFGFWPMLIGGFFLYFSYYGCDQSQAQRLLTTANAEDAQKALVLNGIWRFPITLLYLFFGLLLIPFINTHPSFYKFIQGKPVNFLVPQFIIQFFPAGLKGLMVSGIFAATMSSVDSALNSLSAVTWEDFLSPLFAKGKKEGVFVLRLLTILWGIFAIGVAFIFIKSSETVIELVNMIGSAFYGPILAVFLLGVFFSGINGKSVLLGLLAGVTTNVVLWGFFKEKVSWMWWNFIGFSIPFLITFAIENLRGQTLKFNTLSFDKISKNYALILFVAFSVFILTAFILEKLILFLR